MKNKEIKVYVVNVKDGRRHQADMSDTEFMEIAKDKGDVYSIKDFEDAVNNEDLQDFSDSWIRII